MLYPFIYTRTKYHDYRVVTSKAQAGVPHSVVELFTEVARTMIDAENEQLEKPSWALVKKEGYTLWGMAILNETLSGKNSDKNKDKTRRPVRGFFGFISDTSISKLPYDISFFKELYATYVSPIWDSYEQLEQISCQLPSMSGGEFITKSSMLHNEINVDSGVARIIPYGSDCKGLIEAVFSYVKECSIATNVHRKSQCIEFGKDRMSFMNVVGASDSGIRDKKDIKVYVKKEPVIVHEDQVKDDSKPFEESIFTGCGDPLFGEGDPGAECKDEKKGNRYLKYGLYGFIAIVCLLLIFNGPSIWEAILTPNHTHENVEHEEEIETTERGQVYKTDPFLKTVKSEFNIQDVEFGQRFEIQYYSSSVLKEVQPSEGWIHILPPRILYSQTGVITFVCDPLGHAARDGQIRLVNEEGEESSITIHQSITAPAGDGFSVEEGKANQTEKSTRAGLRDVKLGDETPNSPSSNTDEIDNTETGTK